MADDPRQQPVAIRVARPYASEEEFLERELETLTRTSVVLVGAQSRPQGVILRFELALSNGTPLLRGEGRVIAFKPNSFGALPGLTLRFTRLDVRSKALVDRAAAIREGRARAALEASMGESDVPPMPLPVPAPMPIVGRTSAPPPMPADRSTLHDEMATHAAEAPMPMPAPAPLPRGVSSAPGSVPRRDALLERLRERQRLLSDDAVAKILTKKGKALPSG